MNILETIIEYKKTEVEKNKSKFSVAALENSRFFHRKTLSLKEFLLDESKTGIIAEFKRRSPSKGIINEDSDVLEVTSAYDNHGASALSILTDEYFFGGYNEDILAARINQLPILRKDFMIDSYQLVEAKAIGADVILLIAACLTPLQVKEMASFAKNIGLEVLLEIHNHQELDHICDEVDVVGINNRDLKTFSVDINRSIELSRHIPPGKIIIAESGISNVETIHKLKNFGFKGFLIGENFMKEPDPAIAFASFVNQLKMISS
ncbi:MAG: indole-3-glycerol phosphate synthase TrpC [Bacteroidetes bacterium]|nr:indole-3-glycerol phosphate synthase TrpC [Bacteroidota bacterium]